MNVTWRTLGALCRQFDWSIPRLLHELKNGLAYRTIPEGYVIQWDDPYLRPYLDVEASEISVPYGTCVGAIMPPPPKKRDSYGVILGIEVLPPGAPPDAEVPAPAASPTPPPRKVSRADVERCLRDIMKERPNDPPGEDELFAEMRERLGASPGRNRLRQLRREIAPQWKRPRGHPRNFNSAKKSAV